MTAVLGWHPGAMRGPTSPRTACGICSMSGIRSASLTRCRTSTTACSSLSFSGSGGGADQAEIGEFLRHELEDHFGLTPLPSEPEAIAARVMSWWTAAGKTDGTGCV